MVVKVYIASLTQNLDVRIRQNRVEETLVREGVVFDVVDISDPEHFELKSFIQERADAKNKQLFPLTPQFFDGDIYLGDYDDFDNAVETETLIDFLNADGEGAAVEAGDPSDASAPQMVLVKLYVAFISGSQTVKKQQSKAMMILESKGIEFETIDITTGGMEEHRRWMWENAKSKIAGQRPLTPQFFNMDTYLGDYDDFDYANEVDMIEQFLKLDQALPYEIQAIQPEFEPAEVEIRKISIYVNRSGNADVRKRQITAKLWLENKGFDFEEVDISAPENEDRKHFMMKHATNCKSDAGSRFHPLTPQFFNGNIYCGNYQDFDTALENETLSEFFQFSA